MRIVLLFSQSQVPPVSGAAFVLLDNNTHLSYRVAAVGVHDHSTYRTTARRRNKLTGIRSSLQMEVTPLQKAPQDKKKTLYDFVCLPHACPSHFGVLTCELAHTQAFGRNRESCNRMWLILTVAVYGCNAGRT